MSTDHPLPHIVRCIREQVPGAVPEWLTCEKEYCFLIHGRKPVPREAGIAIVEAGLWRGLTQHPTGRDVAWWQGEWVVTDNTLEKVVARFGSAPLSLILALCHARGVDLEERK